MAEQAIPTPGQSPTPDHIGRYQLKGELGRGAMGVVYLASDPAIGRPLAIKTIRIRDIDDPARQQKLRERLFREARSAGVLSHPNIVTIYDTDEDDGVAYIAMALVNGPTLDRALSGRKPIPGQQMFHLLRQCAAALDYAHTRGVVHRDVKPGNIMIDEDGSVKIADFGIAKSMTPGNTTETRSVTGTPGYMSPEQVQGRSLDGRSDQFSLAVIAYEMLTGERPFQGEHLSTVVYRIVAEQPIESHRLNPTLTPQIDQVLRRALAKTPAGRYPTCTAFIEALSIACAESRGWAPLAANASRSLPTSFAEPAHEERGIAPPPPPPGRPRLGLNPPQRTRRHSRSPLFPILAGIVVALGLTSVFAWQAGLFPALGAFLTQMVSRLPIPASASPATPPAPAPAAAPAPDSPADPAAAPAGATGVPATDTAKPSPIPELRADPGAAAAPAPAATATTAAKPRPQDVWVTSNPPGARVSIDDDPLTVCTSPCMLHGTPGVHHLTYSLAGFKNEYREIRVGEAAMDAPTVALRLPAGTLMLTTNPSGATVAIDGKPVPGTVTPAQIALPPGTHSVTVQRGGRSQTQQVQIEESPVYLRFTLGP